MVRVCWFLVKPSNWRTIPIWLPTTACLIYLNLRSMSEFRLLNPPAEVAPCRMPWTFRCWCTCFPVDGRQWQFCMPEVRKTCCVMVHAFGICGIIWDRVRPTNMGSKCSHVMAILDNRLYYLYTFHNFGRQYLQNECINLDLQCECI